MTEKDDIDDLVVFTNNNARAEAQRALDIRVIVGNPPYSVGQTSGNDNNANVKYASLDAQIEQTFAARSSATNKNSLYDSYVRAIRWAATRIGDAGIIGYVTNGGFIDANTADGLRKTLADEFTDIYVYNLRGNARMAGEQRQKEKGNVFGSGARTTVAITFLVKNPAAPNRRANVHYKDIGDYLTRDEKLNIVDHDTISTLEWQTISPNDSGDWTNQRTEEFEAWQPIGGKKVTGTVFAAVSAGLQTNRDAWVYNFSPNDLQANVTRTIDFYNTQVDEFKAFIAANPSLDPKKSVDNFVDNDPTKISWSSSLILNLLRGHRARATAQVMVSAYRPFTKEAVFYDPLLNHRRYQLPSMFPTLEHANYGFAINGVGTHHAFGVLATDCIPNLHLMHTGQFFARYTYEPVDDGTLELSDDVVDGYRRIDNITDATLKQYRAWYGDNVTMDEIFAFIYGFLHGPDYRSRFAADLKRSLPTIPRIEIEDFGKFASAGQQLLDLHIGYESIAPFPVQIDGVPEGLNDEALYDALRVTKMKYGKRGKDVDKTVIHYSPAITVSGIPEEAQRFFLGTRSAIDWLLDRYEVTTDTPSGIVNDPNDWSREVGNPRYILDLIAKVTTVSVETMKIVDSLPPLQIVEDKA